jgi:hypothetical protein
MKLAAKLNLPVRQQLVFETLLNEIAASAIAPASPAAISSPKSLAKSADSSVRICWTALSIES